LILLIFSFLGNLISIVLLDRTIHYRDTIRFVERIFPNKGLHLVRTHLIKQVDGPPLISLVGGSLIRYWLLPPDFPFLIANWGAIEENCQATLDRFDRTVVDTGAELVLINAGYCNLVTAVRTGEFGPHVLTSNLRCLEEMVETAQAQQVIPILSTLTPVRPRFLFPHLKIGDYSWAHKAAENRAINQYNLMIQDLSREKNIPLIDFHAALSDTDGELIRRYAISDGEHLNPEGYQHLTRFLKKELTRIISLLRPEINAHLNSDTE
jgi:lysophospholipase L1-like esterase